MPPIDEPHYDGYRRLNFFQRFLPWVYHLGIVVRLVKLGLLLALLVYGLKWLWPHLQPQIFKMFDDLVRALAGSH